MPFKPLSALCAALVASGAFAQTKAPEPDYTLSYNAGAVSDYRFRGISQTSFKPAAQAGADLALKSGAYLGLWASNIKWIEEYVGATKGAAEVDLYGGYKGDLAKDLAFDLGLIRYQYPGNTAGKVKGYVDASTTEVYGAITYGLITAKYSRSTTNFIANAASRGSGYFEVSAGFDLGNGLTLTPHLGMQRIPHQAGDAGDYTDYSASLAKDFGNGLALTASAIGTNADQVFYRDTRGRLLGKSTLVVGLKYNF